jgi:chromosome segregation ATPase
MGFVSSIARLVSTLFGQAEGSAERATDQLLVSSPEAVRNQFRKTREDWTKDYNEMKSSVAQLVQIRDDKLGEIKKLHSLIEELDLKMHGAINLYKESQNEALKEEYGKLAYTKEEAVTKIKAVADEVAEQEQAITTFKNRLSSLKNDIENLKKEEAETIADIVSSKKVNELNSKMQGLSKNHQDKNLEAIRVARKQIKSEAKLGSELSGLDKSDLDQKLIMSGKASKHFDAFEEAVKFDKIFIAAEKPKEIAATKPSVNSIIDAVEVKEVAKVEKVSKPKEVVSSKLDDLFS